MEARAQEQEREALHQVEAKAGYSFIEVGELVLKAHALEGRKVTFLGQVMDKENAEGKTLLTLSLDVPPEQRNGMEEVVVSLSGDLPIPSLGSRLAVWGAACGLHVVASYQTCGITVRPLIEAHIVEPR